METPGRCEPYFARPATKKKPTRGEETTEASSSILRGSASGSSGPSPRLCPWRTGGPNPPPPKSSAGHGRPGAGRVLEKRHSPTLSWRRRKEGKPGRFGRNYANFYSGEGEKRGTTTTFGGKRCWLRCKNGEARRFFGGRVLNLTRPNREDPPLNPHNLSGSRSLRPPNGNTGVINPCPV